MKVFVSILILALAFTSSCQKAMRSPIVPSSQIMSYPSGSDQFMILVIEENGLSRDEAKQTAMKEAARVTIENGYSYFSILSEEEVQVVKNSTPQEAPRNLYQELIIEKQPSQSSLAREQSIAETYPALRLKIRCYHEKPAFKSSIKAQDYF